MGKLGYFAVAIVIVATVAPSTAQAMPDGWRFVTGTDGTGVMPCSVVREGDVSKDSHVVNTRLIRNRENKIALVAARPDWELNPRSGVLRVRLSVDGGEPVELEGHPVGPLLITLIAEPKLEQQVRNAQTLSWTMPWATFRPKLAG